MAEIGIIIGSTREGRNGEAIARWVHETAQQATQSSAHTYKLVDLKSFNVPILSAATPPMAADRKYDSPEVTAWSQAIDALDGFIFVSPEYNGSVPGPFKNAVDSLGPEWKEKAIAYVSYGFSGGIHVNDEWRRIMSILSMKQVRNNVVLSLVNEMQDGEFKPAPASKERLEMMVRDLEAELS